MSQYLIDQIAATPNIAIRPCCQIKEMFGEECLESVCIEHADDGQGTTEPVAAVFIFIGTRPVTDWIPLNILKDEKGFLKAGDTLLRHDTFRKNWRFEREPYFLETCVAGVFAVGSLDGQYMIRVFNLANDDSKRIIPYCH